MALRLNHSPKFVARSRRIGKHKVQRRRISLGSKMSPTTQGIQRQINIIWPIPPVIRCRRPYKVTPRFQPKCHCRVIQEHAIEVKVVGSPDLRTMQLGTPDEQVDYRRRRIKPRPHNPRINGVSSIAIHPNRNTLACYAAPSEPYSSSSPSPTSISSSSSTLASNSPPYLH